MSVQSTVVEDEGLNRPAVSVQNTVEDKGLHRPEMSVPGGLNRPEVSVQNTVGDEGLNRPAAAGRRSFGLVIRLSPRNFLTPAHHSRLQSTRIIMHEVRQWRVAGKHGPWGWGGGGGREGDIDSGRENRREKESQT